MSRSVLAANSEIEPIPMRLITVTAMCSIGFEKQNLKYRTNDDSRTNVKKRTEPAITYSRC